MCSEVWVCRPHANQCLPFILADAGFDVFLGNSRGNKYSCKNLKTSPSKENYWNFSIDEIVFLDLPASIEQILKITKSNSLSYIGFSQGTAQAFGAFSNNSEIASKINLFIVQVKITVGGRFNGSASGVVRE